MSMSKRVDIKAQRQRRKRQQRMNQLLIVGGIVLILVALFISPYVINAIRPVGKINSIELVERPLANGLAIGDPNAPVKIEVFSDFQCSSCLRYTETVEPAILESDYIANGLASYVFRQYPFIDSNVVGKESQQAANASMCANEQGRFWDYHDILFANWNGENEGAFVDKRLVAFADNIGLNMNQFNQCFKANTYANEINADYNLGLQYGVTGTPSVFVNGQAVAPGYVPSYEDLVQAIEAVLTEGG